MKIMPVTSAHVSVEEYLGTTYDPDCDYVNGELLERNFGEWDHGELQALLTTYLTNRRKQWNLHIATELRVRTGPSRYRIPDVCVVLGPRPTEPVLISPPFLCVEILSPIDNRLRVRARVTEFLMFGVPYVWLIDPLTRRAWIFTSEGEAEVDDQVLRAGEIAIPMEELFD